VAVKVLVGVEVKVLVGGTGVSVRVGVEVKLFVGGIGVKVRVKVFVGGTGVLVLVLVGVVVEVTVKVRVGVAVGPITVKQALVPPMALQIPVTLLSVEGRAWPVSHMPMPMSPWPMAQLILAQ